MRLLLAFLIGAALSAAALSQQPPAPAPKPPVTPKGPQQSFTIEVTGVTPDGVIAALDSPWAGSSLTKPPQKIPGVVGVDDRNKVFITGMSGVADGEKFRVTVIRTGSEKVGFTTCPKYALVKSSPIR